MLYIYILAHFILILNFISLINDHNDFIIMSICIFLTYVSNIENPALSYTINILGGIFTIIAIMISSNNNNDIIKIKMYLISFIMFTIIFIGYVIYDYKNNDMYYIGIIYPLLCYIVSVICYNKKEYDAIGFINCIIHICIYIQMHILLNIIS
jgi:hypothetical protein